MATLSHPVSPENIQKELNKIWESLETTNVARACLFNLIFYTRKNSRTPYIQRIAQKVIERFPSRVIFVTVDDETKEDSLKTEVAILASSKGEFDVSCDYISIETSGPSQQKIPFVVLPHILPDLPVYLVWGENPCSEDPLFSQMEQFASRLIFDSETTENLPRFASCLLEQHEKYGGDIADLNWARIESWREMFSMAFYSSDKLQQIAKSKKISVSYNSLGTLFFCHTHIQAIYFQAWLACQLNWRFQNLKQEKNTLLFTYRSAEGDVEIVLSSDQVAKLPPGLILSIDIYTTDDEHFSFMRNSEILHQVTYQHSMHDKCDLRSQYILNKAESGHSLVKEICHRGTSEHFLKVLNFVKNMGELSKC